MLLLVLVVWEMGLVGVMARGLEVAASTAHCRLDYHGCFIATTCIRSSSSG